MISNQLQASHSALINCSCLATNSHVLLHLRVEVQDPNPSYLINSSNTYTYYPTSSVKLQIKKKTNIMTLYSIVASQDVQSKSNFSMDKTLEYPTPYFALPFNVRFTFCNGGLEPQLLEGMKSQHGVLLTSAEVLFNEVRSNPSLLSYWMMLDSVLSISARHRCTLESNIPTPRS